MDWFRHYHGLCTDPKLHQVSRAAGVNRGMIIAAWCAVLETASQARERGSAASLDAHALAFMIDVKPFRADQILTALKCFGLLTDDGKVVAWERRQRGSDDPAIRKRAQRERRGEQTANSVGQVRKRKKEYPDVQANLLDDKETDQECHGTNPQVEQTQIQTQKEKKEYRAKKPSPETGAADASLPTLRAGPPRLTAREAVEIWNAERGACHACQWPLSKSREAHLRARLANGLGAADEWTAYVRRIAATPFLRGDNDRGWKAGLDFAVRAEASARILEGAFDHEARAGRGGILEAYRLAMSTIPKESTDDDEIERTTLPLLPD